VGFVIRKDDERFNRLAPTEKMEVYMLDNLESLKEQTEALQPSRLITDDLELLLAALPDDLQLALEKAGDRGELVEVILDLGRLPYARFRNHEVALGEREISEADLEYVIEHVGDFGSDNRAGIERTLHRISVIRNRAGKPVGLTCRIGRAVYGTIELIRDLIESGQSILLLGRPGVGKTTMLRETARVLADDFRKRVVIVDTSNEIAGDGDIPHPAIGRARRMQVARPELQHNVMIEAVENHMPEVVVIDEIGTQLEAEAARTINERGVQLIGTAHGQVLENLMLNPTLSDLIGGIQTVTLGDEEARRRGTQKSVLERKAPPTFDTLVEIQDRDQVVVHQAVADTVDAILRGETYTTEVRERKADGSIEKREVINTPAGAENKPATSSQQYWEDDVYDWSAPKYGTKRGAWESDPYTSRSGNGGAGNWSDPKRGGNGTGGSGKKSGKKSRYLRSA
jgi:stage III sporulation protein SpoIIIAA